MLAQNSTSAKFVNGFAEDTEVGRAPLIIFNFTIYWLGLSICTLQDT